MKHLHLIILINLLLISCNNVDENNNNHKSKIKVGTPLNVEETKALNKKKYGFNPKENTISSDKEPAKMMGMLDAHNKYRIALNLPLLVWSNDLANSAQKWANELKKKNCLMKHSSRDFRGGAGENIAWNSGFNETPEGVVDRWASEKEYFNFNTRKCDESWDKCGHYTQVIWRNTKKVGCAMVQCGDEQIWVCQYWPAGNVNVSRGATSY